MSLEEQRHPGKLSTWTLSWPGEKSVTATSFEANTQNIGGSEGIAWRDPNGQPMVAYLKFGDLVTLYGANGFLLKVVQSDVRVSAPDFIAKHATVYYCTPDALYYHE